MKKILIISVHPDDETLGCGGTILKHIENGDKVYWLIITSMTENHPSGYTQEQITRKTQTIKKVAKEYKFTDYYTLNIPTQLVHRIDFQDFIIKIDHIINKVSPNTVYTMFNNDVHSDHRISFNAVYSCLKSFRKPFIKQIYMFEALSETEFAPSLPSTSFIPNVFIDISSYINKKIEIMSLYENEVMKEPYPRSLSSLKALARYRGSRAGVMYAEAFMLLYELK